MQHARNCPREIPTYLASGILLALMPSCPEGVAAQQAERETYRWRVFVQGGASVSTGVSRTFQQMLPPPQPSVTAQEEVSFPRTGRLFIGVRLGLTDHDEVEVSYFYHPGSVRSTTLFRPPFESSSSRSTLSLRAHYVSFNYVRTFAADGRWRPFATAGLGLALFDVSIETEEKFAGNLGLGLDIEISPRWSFRVENRTFISGAPRSANASRGGTIFQWVPSAGLVLRF